MRSFHRAVVAAVAAAVVSATAAQVEAAYVADFDTTGSAADFAEFQINNTDTTDTGFSVVPGGGNAYLRVTASPPVGGSGGGALQVRYQLAPSNVEGSEVLIPIGGTTDPVRTEARLGVTVREIFGGNDLPTENPFTQFGFAEFDPLTNTPEYASKVIVQFNNALDTITLSHTTNNAGAGNTNIGQFAVPGGTFTPGDNLELQVTGNQARVLYNGVPLTDGTSDYKDLPTDFFLTNFDAGDQLIPFVGVIRGSTALEDEDIIGAGFDNISATNTVVPEPGAIGLLAVAGLALRRRRA